jgi:hypothetical protein
VARRRGELRQRQPELADAIGGDPASAAGRRENGDTPTPGRRVADEEVRGAHHVVGIAGQDGALLAADRREDLPGAGQAGGVRARRLHAGLRPARLDDEHRLGSRAGGGQAAPEAAAVEQALDVDAQRLRAGLGDHVVEKVADLEVDLVAERDAVAEADAIGGGAVDDRDHQCAALAHQPDGAVGQAIGVEHDRRAEGQAVVRHDESHAVGADQTRAALPGDGHELGLPGGALVAGLGEPGGDDHAAADAGGRRLAHGRHQGRTRHRQDSDIGWRRRRRDRGIGGPSQHLGPTRIDRQDLAGEAVAEQEVHDAPAELVLAVGGAEDGNRARVQDALDVDAGRGSLAGQQRGVQRGRHRQPVLALVMMPRGGAFLLATSETVRPHYRLCARTISQRATEVHCGRRRVRS